MKRAQTNGLWRILATSGGVLGIAVSCACSAEPADVFRFESAKLYDRLPIRFHLQNDGPDLLELLSATPSCDCVQVLQWTTNVAAGTTGVVEILYVPDKVGEVDYRVYVKTAAPDQPEIEFAIRGTIVERSSAQTDRDMALYLGFQETQHVLKDPGRVVWVDVRSAETFGRARIPGSLQIPLFAVKTKEFLKGRSVVIVDEGHGSSTLEMECRKLREMGFSDLSIWYGGLNAWWQLGGQVEGSGDSAPDRVPPIALHDIAYAADWLVVDISGGVTNRYDGCEIIPFDVSKKDVFVSALSATLKARPQVSSVLIATHTGDDYEVVAEAVNEIDAFVFYLEGGWMAWEAHRQVMETSRHSRNVVMLRASAGTGGGRSGAGGCGGCPK